MTEIKRQMFYFTINDYLRTCFGYTRGEVLYGKNNPELEANISFCRDRIGDMKAYIRIYFDPSDLLSMAVCFYRKDELVDGDLLLVNEFNANEDAFFKMMLDRNGKVYLWREDLFSAGDSDAYIFSYVKAFLNDYVEKKDRILFYLKQM